MCVCVCVCVRVLEKEKYPLVQKMNCYYYRSSLSDDAIAVWVLSQVITEDGYKLVLDRIPRKNSHKVLFLQHGLVDSALGWMGMDAIHSPALAFHDSGYDVWMGNLRGGSSAKGSYDHVDPSVTGNRRKYWDFGLNEHGQRDVSAMISSMDKVKRKELENLMDDSDGDASSRTATYPGKPYRLELCLWNCLPRKAAVYCKGVYIINMGVCWAGCLPLGTALAEQP